MKNFDPYKRTILFFASMINVCMMTALFSYSWYHFYADMMYTYRFYRRGNYVVLALYAVLLFFFSNMYGSLKIGRFRRIEVLLSQYLSLFLTNVVMYVVISLLAFRFVTPFYLFVVLLAEMLVSTIWNVIVIKLYNRIFQPWKILLVYGERPAADLVYKVEARRDKYAIYDAVNINEGMEQIKKRILDFQAVIIGDIPAVERNDVLKYCYAKKVRAYVIPKISDIILMGADRIHVFDTPFMLSRGYTLSFDQRFGKRTLDIILSVLLLIAASPFMLLTALAIKLYDHGPVFYSQVRCTKGGKEFAIYKFRSMIVDAEKKGGVQLAKEHDERITPVGRVIRAARIDELPQLFNILKGDMSFVGPRPERPELIKEYSQEMPEFVFRMRVKAGLTGYAQVYGKYNTTPYDKLKLDLFYIENYSFWTDMKLILMTVKTIFKPASTEGIEQEQTNALKEQVDTTDVEEIVKEINQLAKEEK
ncbi:MAG: sugar transferase [Lachnospiraceae bacterium]|nr:sugar transferase [Lachnospiraceae bacterium]PWL67617.1 MAG: exopolysaccharide biosynthesis polyprenyl glycosylphosphotransferase [Clostridiaceae bacterium]PWL68334.1 MAG: exopolysaccharide biosynthesis polyprenyl glycosylphosphotransferase [Clostridiaceae bacterium]